MTFICVANKPGNSAYPKSTVLEYLSILEYSSDSVLIHEVQEDFVRLLVPPMVPLSIIDLARHLLGGHLADGDAQFKAFVRTACTVQLCNCTRRQ